MVITDDLREEATYHLNKYVGKDMSNTHNKQQFCNDLFLLLARWSAFGHYVMADKEPRLVFTGMKLDDYNELVMTYEAV